MHWWGAATPRPGEWASALHLCWLNEHGHGKQDHWDSTPSDYALLQQMKCRCCCSRGISQTERAVIVPYEVSNLVWNMVSVSWGFNQLLWNCPKGIRKVKQNDCQVTVAFSNLLYQLCDNSCVLDASWHLLAFPVLHRGVDVCISQEELHHVLGNSTKEYLTLNTEEWDVTELPDGACILLLSNPDTLYISPLLCHFPPPSDDLDDLLLSLQKFGAPLVDDIWHSTWTRCWAGPSCSEDFLNLFQGWLLKCRGGFWWVIKVLHGPRSCSLALSL